MKYKIKIKIKIKINNGGQDNCMNLQKKTWILKKKNL